MYIRKVLMKFCQDKVKLILEHEEHMSKHLDEISKMYQQKNEKIFDNYKIYENTIKTQGFQKKLNRSLTTYLTIWGFVGGISYFYINPWVALIPTFFTIQTISSYWTGKKYLGKLVKSITLEKDQKYCQIELGNEQILKVNIDDNDLLNVSDIIKVSNDQIEEQVNEKYRQSNYVIQFETKFNSKIYEDLRVMITQENAIIPNIQLMKDIITGENVQDYIYQEKIIQNDNKETDEELEKRLKEELKI